MGAAVDNKACRITWFLVLLLLGRSLFCVVYLFSKVVTGNLYGELQGGSLSDCPSPRSRCSLSRSIQVGVRYNDDGKERGVINLWHDDDASREKEKDKR